MGYVRTDVSGECNQDTLSPGLTDLESVP